MREDVTMVLVMAGMKVLMMFAAAHWRATGMKHATGNAAAHWRAAKFAPEMRAVATLKRACEATSRRGGCEVGETGDPPRTARRSRLLTHPLPAPFPLPAPPAPVQGQSLDMRRWRSSPHWL